MPNYIRNRIDIPRTAMLVYSKQFSDVKCVSTLRTSAFRLKLCQVEAMHTTWTFNLSVMNNACLGGLQKSHINLLRRLQRPWTDSVLQTELKMRNALCVRERAGDDLGPSSTPPSSWWYLQPFRAPQQDGIDAATRQRRTYTLLNRVVRRLVVDLWLLS